MLIRALTAWDRPTVAEMLRLSGAFSAEEVRVALEVFDEGMVSAGPDGYALFGANGDGGLLGYVCVGRVPLTATTWDMYWLCVHPAALRRGVARSLVAHAEAYAVEHGARRLVVQTSGRPDYAPMRAFYAVVGYEVVGRIPDYFQEGDDGVFYSRVIGPKTPAR